MRPLKEIQQEIMTNVIAAVLTSLSQKAKIAVKDIQLHESPLRYVADVVELNQVLTELYDLYELGKSNEMDELSERFSTVESIIEHVMLRIVDEKIIPEAP